MDAVILLGILHQAGILFREKEFVPGNAAIAAGQIGSPPAHFHPLADDFVLATLAQSEAGGISVSLRILAKIFKAGIAISGAARRFRIDLVQEIQHGSDGGMQAVQIQSVEANASGVPVFIVIAQPADKIEHIGIAPHPGGKSLEAGKRINRVLVFTLKSHILIYAICIGPIRLDCDCVESFFRDQALGNLSAQAIELVSPVRWLLRSERNERRRPS